MQNSSVVVSTCRKRIIEMPMCMMNDRENPRIMR